MALVFFGALLLGFQNCGPVQFLSPESSQAPTQIRSDDSEAGGGGGGSGGSGNGTGYDMRTYQFNLACAQTGRFERRTLRVTRVFEIPASLSEPRQTLSFRLNESIDSSCSGGGLGALPEEQIPVTSSDGQSLLSQYSEPLRGLVFRTRAYSLVDAELAQVLIENRLEPLWRCDSTQAETNGGQGAFSLHVFRRSDSPFQRVAVFKYQPAGGSPWPATVQRFDQFLYDDSVIAAPGSAPYRTSAAPAAGAPYIYAIYAHDGVSGIPQRVNLGTRNILAPSLETTSNVSCQTATGPLETRNN
jgi:hypothetical protein